MSGPFGSSQWMYKSGDYEIANSLRFVDEDVPELLWPASAHSGGNRRTFTHSLWVKRGLSITSTHQVIFEARDGDDGSSDNIKFENGQLCVIYQDGTLGRLKSTALFFDSSAWYHIVVAVDTTQGTNTNRIKVYVNGVQLTSFTDANTYMDQNADTRTSYASSDQQYGNSRHPDNDHGLDGYLAEVNFVDGLQLTPASFAETDDDYGHWKPKKYAGAYGDEGYYLDFKSSGVGTAGTATIGADRSGNTNHFTSDNIATTDQMSDSPSFNFATLNPLQHFVTNLPTQTEGNLKTICGSVNTGSKHCIAATMAMTSGKWYFEVLIGNTTNSHFSHIGVANADNDLFSQLLSTTANSGNVPWDNDYGWGFDGYNGSKEHDNTQASYGSQVSLGDIIGVAVDMDNGKIWFAENNTWLASGDPAAGSNEAYSNLAGTIVPVVSTQDHATAFVTMNFGQDSTFSGGDTSGAGASDGGGIGDFYYAPPSGFLALCASNFAEPVKPSEYFSNVLYTGNQNANLAITGVGFQPDMVWGKNRSSESNHWLFDSIRGVTKMLAPDLEADEEDQSGITAFGSDGFTLGNWIGSTKTNENYVAWNWKAGGSAAAVGSNTDGSINTTDTSVSTTAGFSISTFTGNATSGATVGHGLGVVPEWVMVVCRSSAGNWAIYHANNTAAPATDFLALETTGATADVANIWNDTAPTSSVFSLGNNAAINGNGETFVAYCWHSVEGFSKFGSWIGNANDVAPFIYTGFRPAWIMWKKTSGAENWFIVDNARTPHNKANKQLWANDAIAEQTSAAGASELHILSNGFKPTGAGGAMNGNEATYVFFAFAETPFKYSNAR